MNRHKQIARRLLPLIDLTSLNDDDTDQTIKTLCDKARSDKGQVAAVCVYPKFVNTAIRCLRLTGISVATVVNFPHGKDNASTTCDAISQAIKAGATEIDVVMPYHHYQKGDIDYVCTFIKACRQTCDDRACLKVILETGRLLDPVIIEEAALHAIDAGADFIKTSTGKVSVGATVSATEAMCHAIKKAFDNTGGKIGVKVSGGIRFIAQAMPFLAVIEEILGEQWLEPQTCRFGASTLLDDVLSHL